MIPISVTLLTKNSAKYLTQVLDSLRSFDEVLIYDNGSTDHTLQIAEVYPNVRIVKGTFEGFGPTHNKATGCAKHDWILSIDSDEVVSSKMTENIASTALNEDTVYSFPRNNYFNGKFIRWCGWHPDRQYRLYNRTKTRFTDAQVHESIIVLNMQHQPLDGPIIHYSYDSIADFLSKMQSYSRLFAEQNKGIKSSSPLKALMHGIFAFLKSYVIKKGFMGGYEGFVISSYNAHTAFYKYLKLYEANSNKSGYNDEKMRR
jgi:glycosyltransferase involved in cell wall biosynthesis